MGDTNKTGDKQKYQENKQVEQAEESDTRWTCCRHWRLTAAGGVDYRAQLKLEEDSGAAAGATRMAPEVDVSDAC